MSQNTSYDHILLVTNDLTHDRRMIRICETLVAAGKKVLLVGREQRESKALSTRSFDQSRVKCRFRSGLLFYLEINIRLAWAVRSLKYKTITANDLDTLLPAYISAKRSGNALLFDAHELFIDVPELIDHPIKRWIWKMIGLKIIPHTTARYTVGHELSRILHQRYGKTFEIIRNVPKKCNDTPHYHRNDAFTIAYLGVLNVDRGLIALLTAVSQIDHIRIDIIGDGVMRTKLEQLSAEYELQDRVIFHGMLTPEKFRPLLCSAHLGYNVLNPTSANYRYSLANKFFDYISHGLPVIVTDLPEYRTIINDIDCGYFIPKHQAETLKVTLQHIISHEEEWQQKVKNCDIAAQKYNWENEAQKLLKLYKYQA